MFVKWNTCKAERRGDQPAERLKGCLSRCLEAGAGQGLRGKGGRSSAGAEKGRVLRDEYC